MHALHRQHLTITSKRNALPFRDSVCNVHACPQLGYHRAARAASASCEVHCALLKQQAAEHIGNSPGCSSSSSSSNDEIVVLDASDRQTRLTFIKAPQTASAVLSVLEKLAGPGVLMTLEGRALLGAEELPPGDHLYLRQVPTATPGSVPRRYKNILVHIIGLEPVMLNAVSRATLEKMLDKYDCYNVQDPISKAWVTPESLELQDDMRILACPLSIPFDTRISTLESFNEDSTKAFEDTATEAVYRHLKKTHSSVKALDIRVITATDGSKREVDGAVVADGCAAIVKAEQVLDDDAVWQLSSCLEFISDKELAGPAAELKGKKLLGFVAGGPLSTNPGRVEALMRDCQQLGYGIFLSNGQCLALDNSRITPP